MMRGWGDKGRREGEKHASILNESCLMFFFNFFYQQFYALQVVNKNGDSQPCILHHNKPIGSANSCISDESVSPVDEASIFRHIGFQRSVSLYWLFLGALSSKWASLMLQR